MTNSRESRRRRRQLMVIAAIVVFAMLAAALSGVVTAFADPRNQPGGTSAVLDKPELDTLQQRAGEIRGELKHRPAAVPDTSNHGWAQVADRPATPIVRPST